MMGRVLPGRVEIVIPTCKRPDMLRALLSDLFAQKYSGQVGITVIQDGIFDAYDEIRAEYPGVRWRLYDEPHGRELYWSQVNDTFNALSVMAFTYLIYLADDIRVTETFVSDAIEALKRSGAHALNLLDDGRAGDAQWGILYEGCVNGFHRTGWLDMCFITTRPALSKIGFYVTPIFRPWKLFPQLGSGVGKQISKRYKKSGMKIYQVSGSLVSHGAHDSVMNSRDVPLVGNIFP